MLSGKELRCSKCNDRLFVARAFTDHVGFYCRKCKAHVANSLLPKPEEPVQQYGAISK